MLFGIDISPTRVRFAKDFGIAARTNRSALEQFQSFTHGRGFDHVLICADTPSDDTVELAGIMARDRGHVVSLGVVGLLISPASFFMRKNFFFRFHVLPAPGRYDLDYEEKGLDYPIGYVRWTEGRNLEAFVDLISNGKVNVKPLITHRFKIEDAKKAYDLITGKTRAAYLGILLTYDEKIDSTKKTVSLISGSNKIINKNCRR